MAKSKPVRAAVSSARSRHFLHNLDPTARLMFVCLGCLSVGLFLFLAWNVLNSWRVTRLTLVAGSKDGESYILSKAIEQVVEAQTSKIQIDVVETGGTKENLDKLETGAAQLATAQADVAAGKSARMVVTLYPDSFQLIVKNNVPVNQFSDLKGKRIALPAQGGQYRSFLEVANHFGLQERDFVFVGADQEAANNAFRQNRADAMFRVRALGNKTVLEMVQQHQGRLIAIDQAAAMRIKFPAFEPAVIPRGVYRGSNPPVPETDLPTITVQRTLLANQKVDSQVIRQVTEILDEHRQDLADSIPSEFSDVKPLVASISKPTATGGTGIPIHPGTMAYFDRDKPSFLQENADFLALLLTTGLLLGSWLWELKAWLQRRQKDEADRHIESAIQLMTAVQEQRFEPEAALNELDRVFAQAANDLIREKISQESFRTLSEAYKAVRDVIEHKGRLAQQSLRRQ